MVKTPSDSSSDFKDRLEAALDEFLCQQQGGPMTQNVECQTYAEDFTEVVSRADVACQTILGHTHGALRDSTLEAEAAGPSRRAAEGTVPASKGVQDRGAPTQKTHVADTQDGGSAQGRAGPGRGYHGGASCTGSGPHTAGTSAPKHAGAQGGGGGGAAGDGLDGCVATQRGACVRRFANARQAALQCTNTAIAHGVQRGRPQATQDGTRGRRELVAEAAVGAAAAVGTLSACTRSHDSEDCPPVAQASSSGLPTPHQVLQLTGSGSHAAKLLGRDKLVNVRTGTGPLTAKLDQMAAALGLQLGGPSGGQAQQSQSVDARVMLRLDWLPGYLRSLPSPDSPEVAGALKHALMSVEAEAQRPEVCSAIASATSSASQLAPGGASVDPLSLFFEFSGPTSRMSKYLHVYDGVTYTLTQQLARLWVYALARAKQEGQEGGSAGAAPGVIIGNGSAAQWVEVDLR